MMKTPKLQEESYKEQKAERRSSNKNKFDPGQANQVDENGRNENETEQKDADLLSLKENVEPEMSSKSDVSTYESLKAELDESKARCKTIEKEKNKLLSELDHVVKERNFLVEKLENNEREFEERLDEDLRNLRKQVDELVEERTALLKKVGILQLNKNKPKASTKTQGTQADFTVSIVGTVGAVDDNASVQSKVSSFSIGSKSERSAISGISMDTMGTSDTKSVKMHASKVISLARRMLGKKPKKGAVSNSPESDPKNSPPKSHPQNIRPPIPPSPRRNRLPTKPRAKLDKPTSSTPSKLPPPPPKPKSTDKRKSKSRSSRKSGGSKPLSFKETPEDMDFYLPQVSLDGTVEDSDNKDSIHDMRKKDPTALVNALRPWQVEFLESVQITTSTQLVFASKYKSKEIAKAMVKWRKERNMKQMRSKACAVALHIWTRTIEARIKSSLLERTTSAELDLPEKHQNKSNIKLSSTHGVFEQATEI